jgi:DNA-binding transcriptional LysR family regulator
LTENANLPTLAEWATLRAVVEKGGVTGAARSLHISQSAVSKRLRSLEQCYGIPLMQRVGGRLRLTDAGEKLYLLASLTLDRNLALCEEIHAMTEGKTSLRMLVTFGIGEHLLPDLLLKFKDEYPDYQIDFRMSYSRDIERELAKGSADIALMEIAPEHPDILVQKWQDDELWMVCGRGHSLFGKELLPVDEIGALNYVLREKRSSIRESLDEALQRIGISNLIIDLEVASSEAIIDILSRGKHVSFMPRFAVNDRVIDGDLFHIKIAGFRIMRTLWIARNRNTIEHPVAEAFIQMMRDESVQEVE